MFSQYLTMEAEMLLSLVNMQLRNRFDSIGALARFYELDETALADRLAAIGYCYAPDQNQFRPAVA